MTTWRSNHIITAVTEHKAVLDTCKRLEKSGFRVTYLPVQKDGLVDLDDLKRAMDEKTILVTIMAANNEIGVVQPIAEIGKLCHEKGVIFHTDATQYVGKVPMDVIKQNLDLVSISGHKMYGPKGVGALYVRRKNPRVQLSPLIDGGGHERGMRSGTLNVPGIAGLGKACAICYEEMPQESCRMAGLRNRLRDKMEMIWHTVRSASDSAASIPKRKWITLLRVSRRQCSGCVNSRHSTKWRKKELI